ncbi:FtsX-like permease family protein [Ruminococcus sp. 5_1_39BFAA]|uniref:ABC transporter permease n=1 Tax=Ruminococcus sp. 5_1_39BFAA TaxID=457412 RepID=UPI0035670352
MRNNNQKVIRRISDRSMKNNRMRNRFAMLAICLTSLLFTTIFSMGIGMVQVFQEQTMREVGGRFHAGLKHVTMEQYEKITDNPLVVSSSYNILLGMADNLKKRQGEIRYAEDETELENAFISLKEGGLPEKEDDLIADTITLKELKVPAKVGEKVPLEFSFQGQEIKKEFTLCGWYEGSEISHASELYVSKAYWEKLRGDRTDEDFAEWYDGHPDAVGAGLVNGNLFFENDRNIEENVRQCITEAGYSPEGDTSIAQGDVAVQYGVNWAYMSNRMESIDPSTLLLLGSLLFIIVVTGYLIIYNIFQISILKEISFYGLLKTIGTTKKQLRRLIYRQAWKLSAVGIPVGLLLGYFAGQFLMPYLIRMSNYEMTGGFRFSPWIFVFGGAFSFFTVLISCRKPAKIAGSVSPIEAVRYTEGSTGKRKKEKKSDKGAKIRRMALANLGRNRKKTAVVILSISLSVILLELVVSVVGSFRMDEYMEDRIAGDYMVGNVNFTRASPVSYDFSIDEEMIEGADAMDGVEETEEVWTQDFVDHSLSKEGRERFAQFFQEGKLETDPLYFGGGQESVDKIIREVIGGEETISEARYGYTEKLLKNLTPVKGTIDMEKFATGKYVLLEECRFTDNGERGDCLYEPGDKITLRFPTEDTEQILDLDENGEYVADHFSNMEEKEYEVMAVVSHIPDSMSTHFHGVNELVTVVPLADIKGVPHSKMIAKSYTVKEECKAAFEEFLKYYTENVNVSMGYLSKGILADEFSGMIGGISTVGYALCGVIAVIGILNFANSMFTSILTRKQELAVMQSIGMTKGQIRTMILWESGYYLLISGCISIVAGSLLAYVAIGALNGVVKCFDYQYTAVPFIIMIPVFAVISVFISLAAYSQTQKMSVVERLRHEA